MPHFSRLRALVSPIIPAPRVGWLASRSLVKPAHALGGTR